jgi:DNA-binding response OmpR family regulator
MHLLVVEDETRMAALLKKGLTEEGYSVTIAEDGVLGFELARTSGFDLIVLDVMLPGMDGYTIAKRLRHEDVRTPILMLTARDASPDIVRGLDVGADDYLTKPFSFEVLLARVRALLRRGPAAVGPQLRVGDLMLDPSAHQVWRRDEPLTLTKTEFQLLEALMRRPGQVMSRSSLIETVWGFEREVESNTLDAFIRLLRAKLEPPGAPKLIRTIRGIGYSITLESGSE